MQRSCGKVIFLHLSVSHSVHMGCLPQCMLGYTPWAGTLPWADTRPQQVYPPGRYIPLGRYSPLCQVSPPRTGTPPPRWSLQRALRILLACTLANDDDDDDDVARSGRCAYMLGLSVNSVISVEGTLFFIFSFRPSSFSTIFFYIYFLSSSSSSSFPIISLLSSYKFFCSLLLFLDFTWNLLYSSSSFLLMLYNLRKQDDTTRHTPALTARSMNTFWKAARNSALYRSVTTPATRHQGALLMVLTTIGAAAVGWRKKHVWAALPHILRILSLSSNVFDWRLVRFALVVAFGCLP